MTTEKSSLYSALAYAGALPFIACALLPYFQLTAVERLGSFDYIAAAYGLAIVSFLAGVHWGTYLYNDAQSPINLFITSNITTVVVWIAFLTAGPRITLLVLIVAFVSLLTVDRRLFRVGLITRHYFRTRCYVTAIVIASLLATTAAV